jgi:hypothetical protein
METNEPKAFKMFYGRDMYIDTFLNKQSALDYMAEQDGYSRSQLRFEKYSVAPKGQSFHKGGEIPFEEYEKLLKRDAAAKEAMSKLSPETCKLLKIYPL